MGASNESPAAMYVERRIRCVEGEYEGAETPDLRVLRQKVVGRTGGEKMSVSCTAIYGNGGQIDRQQGREEAGER